MPDPPEPDRHAPVFPQLIARLCGRYLLDPATVTEPALLAAFEREQAATASLTARAKLAEHAIVALGFEKSATPRPEELTAKAATLRQPSDEDIGNELAGFAVGCGILAPAERAEWERRLAKDRRGWTQGVARESAERVARADHSGPVRTGDAAGGAGTEGEMGTSR